VNSPVTERVTSRCIFFLKKHFETVLKKITFNLQSRQEKHVLPAKSERFSSVSIVTRLWVQEVYGTATSRLTLGPLSLQLIGIRALPAWVREPGQGAKH
jgi:hypothetical protein